MIESVEKELPLVIITYQDIFQSVTRQRDGVGESYQHCSALVRLSPAALKSLELNDGALLELRSVYGSVVVQARLDPNCEEGVGYMPASLYSNRLASYDPSSSRLPSLRRIEVIATPTKQSTTPISELQGGGS